MKRGDQIGKFKASGKLGKLGKLEFNANVNQTLFDEVVVSALAVVEARRRAAVAAVNANPNAGIPARTV